MTDPKAVAEWAGRVEETFNALKWASYDAQERACQSVAGRDGDEAAAKLKELFAAFEKRAAEITAKLDVTLKTDPEAQSSIMAEKPKARVEEPIEPKKEGSWRRIGGPYRPDRVEAKPDARVDETEAKEPNPDGGFRSRPQPKEEPKTVTEEEQAKSDEEPKAGLPAVVPSSLPEPVPTWDQAIAVMNRQHAIIDNVGGKAVIASWEPSTIDPSKIVVVFQNKESFLLRYSNRSVSIEVYSGRGGTVRVPLGQWWLGHRDRQQYRGVIFRPGGPKVVNECLNLWQGWGIEAKPGNWGLMRYHIEQVIAGGDREFGDYLERWIAWAIQNPGAQAEVALVLIGLKGAGKGTLVRCLQRIFGAHAFQVTSREEVIGKFNGHLQDCVLFVADEAYWGGDKRCVGRLQGMITEPTLPIERKGIDLIQVPNYLHVVMLAEPGWVIPAGRYERRYAALEVSAVKRGDKDYFRRLHRQIADGGAEGMFYDLGRMELGDWHPREIPEALLNNPALQRQQGFTLPPLEQWFVTLLHEGVLPGALPNRPNTAFTWSLLDDAKERIPRLKFDLSEVGLRNFLVDEGSVGIPCIKYRAAIGNGWSFAPLAELREAWSRRYGPMKWDNPATEWGKKAKVTMLERVV